MRVCTVSHQAMKKAVKLGNCEPRARKNPGNLVISLNGIPEIRYLDRLLMYTTKFLGENNIGWLKSFLHKKYRSPFFIFRLHIGDDDKGNAP